MADPKANDKQGYHRFIMRNEVPGMEYVEYGSFEVFWGDVEMNQSYGPDEQDHLWENGWYWWACFPGCMPDGEPSGPFATSQEAYDNAQEGA